MWCVVAQDRFADAGMFEIEVLGPANGNSWPFAGRQVLVLTCRMRPFCIHLLLHFRDAGGFKV
jgi:hypothetical protein